MKHALLIATACFLGLLSTVGASLPYPILPPLFAGTSGGALTHFMGWPPKLLFGLALAINPLGLLIGSALMGSMSDRYGRRPLLLITAIGAALGHALTAWALLIQSYPLFMLARFATGLMEGNGAIARALLADQLQGSLRTRALSWLSGAFYMGWLAGPLIAGLTLAWGLTAPFWVAVAALLLAALLVLLAVPRDVPSSAVSSVWEVARARHSLRLLAQPQLRTLFLVHLAYTCGVTAFYEFYPLWLVEVPGFGASGIAWTTAALCGLMTASSLIAGGPSRHAPLRRVGAYALLSACAVATVALGNARLGMAAIVLFGIPNAFYNAILPDWCTQRFGEHGHGAVMGLLSTTFCLANIAMALAGALLTLIDTRFILLLGAVLTAWASRRIHRWHAELARAPELAA